jgi:tRNA-Thr(GGU) m(6)t(6)A37 methyltransferase TsaA
METKSLSRRIGGALPEPPGRRERRNTMIPRRNIRFRSKHLEIFGFLLAVAALPVIMGMAETDEKTETRKPGDWTMVMKSIGVIRSPYTPEKGAPRQGGLAAETESTIVLEPEYVEGLTDIEKFSHVIVLYAFDRSTGWSAMVKPPGSDVRRGVFATRSPRRPNPIGYTVVKLAGREGATLRVLGLDAFDGTPVLDLKPYIPRFDRVDGPVKGWNDKSK